MVEPAEVGMQFTRWPLHMTIVPWFTAENLNDVENAISPTVARHEPFALKVGERAYYGIKKLAVKLVVNTPKLQQLHDDIQDTIIKEKWPLNGRFTGVNFSPHVTQKDGRDADGIIIVDKLYIAEALPQGYRKLVSVMELGV